MTTNYVYLHILSISGTLKQSRLFNIHKYSGYVRIRCILSNVDCRLEAKLDEKGKNEVTDSETENEGEPSEVALNLL